jgi:hypothetical protein
VKRQPALICQLKITMKVISPPIWRRVQVARDIPLDELHMVLQRAMGWTNSHLHQYVFGQVMIGIADGESNEPLIDERKIWLEEVAGANTTFVYEYDFGDGWEHDVVVEKIFAAEAGVEYPRCVDGGRRCPPEDCGGPLGYMELVEIVANPKHERHEDMLEWLGEVIDPEAFDLESTDASLRPRRRRASRPRRVTRH